MSQKKRRDFFPFNIIHEIKEKKCAKKKSKEIDQELIKDRKIRSINIIVTGHSCSGKSSIIEQLKLQKIFTEELDEAKAAMHGLRSLCMDLLSNMSSSHKQKLSNVDVCNGLILDKHQSVIDQFLNEIEDAACPNFSVSDNQSNKKTEFQSYLVNNFKRILDPRFSITFQDFVFWRKSGFTNMFERDVLTYPFMGHQGNFNITHFRKTITGKSKHYSHFDNTDVVLFCSSLKIYCHTDKSDDVTSKLEDEIDYFKRFALLHWFFDSDFILFLTHSDIFESQFDKINFPKDFLEFLSSRKVEAHGPTEFYEYIFTKFYDAMQKSGASFRRLFRYTVNCVHCENMQETVNLTTKLMSELPFSCRCCRLDLDLV